MIDVRELDEFEQGAIPGAMHIPRGRIESRIEGRRRPTARRRSSLSCQSGARSAFAAQALGELGYENVESLARRLRGLEAGGHEWSVPRLLDAERRARATRATSLIPEVGEAGQLQAARLQGAAARRRRPRLARRPLPRRGRRRHARDRRRGHRRRSNLQRQVLHTTDRDRHAEDGSRPGSALEALNPDVQVVELPRAPDARRTSTSILAGYDVVVDGTDNFPTRYLLNDASLKHRIPVVHASIFRFEGQLTRVQALRGPLLPLPVPRAAAAGARAVVRRGRRARRAARHHGLAAGDRGAQAAARHRRLAGRPAAAVRRARDELPGGRAAPRPGLPGLRRARRADRVHRLRAVLRHADRSAPT